uniref:Uncharacterized protein n=1 Tax=Triticum urartu TaxID=4572 RepID=A0A8R7UY80_TRIUA
MAWGPALASTDGEHGCCQPAKVLDSQSDTSLDQYESHGDAREGDVWQGSTHSLPPSTACPWLMARAGALGCLQEAQGQGIG